MQTIVCPVCNGDLKAEPDAFKCRVCSETYNAPFGVPLLIPNSKMLKRLDLPSEEFAQDLGRVAGKCDPKVLSDLREAFSFSFHFDNPVIQSESTQFLNRLRSSGVSIRDPYPPSDTVPSSPFSVNDSKAAAVEVKIITFPEVLVSGEVISFNIQITNKGSTVLTSKGQTPFRLSYWVVDGDGQQQEGLRTDLLIELRPNSSITQPIRVALPKPGKYALKIKPLIENVKWFDSDSTIEIEVPRPPRLFSAKARRPFNPVETQITRDYGADHAFALLFLQKCLADMPGETKAIIEIGGNFHPSTSALTQHDVINVDVDPFGLLSAQILYKDQWSIRHIVADGMHLPVADNSVDAMVFFSTFHHFPEPVTLLQHIKRKLKPTGRLFLLCEPVGHVFAENAPEEFIKELKLGAYEQSFVPWEYNQLLTAAGFEIVDGILDVGSAKIVARPTML